MKNTILVLLLTALLLTGCGGEDAAPADPREGLVEHYFDGLYFYLGQELEQTEVQDAGISFTSDTMELHVESLWLQEFDEGISSGEDFAAAYADMVYDDVDDVQIYQANGVWYDVISMSGYHLVCGFYVQGDYGWMIGVVTEDFNGHREEIIRYVTLGKIEEGFDPGEKPESSLGVSYYKAGDEMFDLTVTAADGQSYTVSELLQEKKLVVLNFWFADCSWCVKEFPVLEVAYQQYREDVEILALDPLDGADQIKSFQSEHSLSFPMASCSKDTAIAFGVNGYPTSVFIDRTGTICLVHSGAITDTATFYDLFDHFTAEDYQQKILTDIGQLAA